DDPGLNTIATPILATDAGILIHRAIELSATGILHCVGSEHIDRVTLARRAVTAFGLDESLLSVRPPHHRMNPPHATTPPPTPRASPPPWACRSRTSLPSSRAVVRSCSVARLCNCAAHELD